METKEYKDITFKCKDEHCEEVGHDFIWTAGEQEFFAEKGFTNPPARCREARSRRKRERNSNRDNNSSGNNFAYRTENN